MQPGVPRPSSRRPHATSLLVVLTALLCLPAPGRAQQLSPEEYLRLTEKARELYRAGRWEEAEAAYRTLVELNPADGELWLILARTAERQDRDAAAIDAYGRVLALGYGTRSLIDLRVAALYADSDDKARALDWIERSLRDGLEGRERITRHRAFKRYENDPRYRELAGLLPLREFSRVEGWLHDLDYLVEEIRRLHAAPDRPAFSEEFERTVAEIRSSIPGLDDERIAYELRRLMASLGDGHSGIWSVSTERVGFRALPLDLYWFEDGIFVVAGEGEATSWVGHQVVAVAGVPVDELADAFAPYISRDNPMGLRASVPPLLTRPGLLRAVGATDDSISVAVTLRDRHGGRHQVELAAEEPRPSWRLRSPPPDGGAPVPLYLRMPSQNIWLQQLPEQRAVYVQYNRVWNAPGRTIEAYADSILATLERLDARAAIVDVRRNGGGNNFLNWPLVRALIRFESAEPDRRIYVLAGRHTFSAAQNFANWVERLTDAVFVGEPTGSRPNFTGETTRLTLPYSGLQGSISSRYWQDSHATDERVWIAPDLPVSLSSADYFANRDPVLAAVLRTLERR